MEETNVYVYPYNINNLENIKGWNVMISPEGEVYKIYERNELVSGHDLFAETYVLVKYNKDINEIWKKYQKINTQHQSINLAPKDILINLFGFVNYEFFTTLEITGPDFKYRGLSVTDKQVLVLEKLIELNKDKSTALSKVLAKEI